MSLLNFLKKRNNDNFSQSGQDQFAYNITGANGVYLEIGAHHPIINSNTYKLEVECGWRGISVEFDKSFQKFWKECPERTNDVIWDDAFNVKFENEIKNRNLPKKINYLSCDIEPPVNTFNILKKLINLGLVFDFISFEHDKYNIGDEFEKLSNSFLTSNGYKIAIKDVYSRSKLNKVYETWFINESIKFTEISYRDWQTEFYTLNSFTV
tara:strand:+ start:464 stop:1093 length:630 start_codon:yes stop_codon:yes gene_type:complete